MTWPRQFSVRTLSLLDQIVFSAANFLLILLLARHYSEVEVAGYGIGLSIALMIQSTQRTCYVVQNAVLAPAIFRRRAPVVLGQHLVIWGCILAAEALSALLWLGMEHGAYQRAILASVLVCSLIYAQLDFDRMALAKYGRLRDSFFASAGFLLLNGILFFAVSRWHLSFLTVMALVGAYALLKMLRLILLLGRPDFLRGWRRARRDCRRFLASSVLGVIGYSGHSHAPLFILGYVAAPVHSAAFVALRGLMQPVMVIIRSFDVIDKNLVQASAMHTPAAMRGALLRQLAAYGALSSAAIAGSLWLGPWLIRLVYGEAYAEFFRLLPGWAAFFSLIALMLPMETVVIKLQRLRRYNRLRLWAGATGVLMALALCPPFGATGALLACIGGAAVSLGCAMWLIRDVLYLPARQRVYR